MLPRGLLACAWAFRRTDDPKRQRRGGAFPGSAIQTALSLGLAAWALAGAGCVAIPVGRTQVFRHTEERLETEPTPSRTTAGNPRVMLLQRGGTVEVSLTADIVKEHAHRRFVKETTVRRQRRLAFGLFPGAAEIVWMPKGALASTMSVPRGGYNPPPDYCGYYRDRGLGLGAYALAHTRALLLCAGTIQAAYTVESLLLAPFESWKCESHDFADREHWRRGTKRLAGQPLTEADASSSPRLRALAELPEDLRRKIGARTCFDVQNAGGVADGVHLGLAGFHKYQAVSVSVAEAEAGEAEESERRTEKGEMEGPYEVELAIPGLGYSERRVVGRGKTKTTFELPGARHETAIMAQVSMRECLRGGEGPTPELTRQALRGLAGQGNRFDVNLPETPGDGDGGHGAGGWEILQIRPTREGKYLVRVHLADSARRAEAAREVAAEVRRRIREDYANRHPSVRVAEVRDWVKWKTDGEDPCVLLFSGWAFSASPLEQGWHWDDNNRRGKVRLMIPDGVPEEQVLQWARQNIASIVADKGVALEVGGTAVSGTAFRIVSERFENGILAIEFEAVE